MDSNTPTEEYEPSGAFEAIKVLGRELQHSKERIRQLEAALSECKNVEKGLDSAAGKQLLDRAMEAEDLNATLKADLKASSTECAKLKATVQTLQVQVNQLQGMKQEHNDADDAAMLKGSAEILELKGKLQKENEESKAKLSARNHEISRLSSELANVAADKEALTVHFRNLEGVALPWSIEKYVAFADDHQKINRPDYISLQPVCSSGVDLKTYIEADRDFRWMTHSFLCLHEPTRILWTSTSCQIGLAFGPMFQFKALGQQLVKHSEFSGIYGKQLELFFQSEEDIYYAGTYHCQGLPENPQGCLRTDVKSATTLADITVPLNAGYSQFTRDSLRNVAKGLYMEGVMKAECVIFRCTGFNHRVHDTFSKRHAILSTLPIAGAPSTSRQVSGSPRLPLPQKPRASIRPNQAAPRSGPAPRKRSRGD